MERTEKQELLVIGRQLKNLILRPLLIVGGGLLLSITVCVCEELVVGYIVHSWFIVNGMLMVLLAAMIDLTLGLFQAGWFRFSPSRYTVNIPWKGLRGGSSWKAVDYVAIIPGKMAMKNCSIALLIVEKKGFVVALEYRETLLFQILSQYPQLHVAILRGEPALNAICRELDIRSIGWLPLTWIEHEDGSGELRLKSMDTSLGN